ncbi:MAG: DUF1127 domain-containing protein [Alphaproteobacteria bacterium]|nr:DUF1127 domain-containing protein [Alphaproteobacteria bacterium]
MNDYAQHQANLSGDANEGIIARFINNWQARRAVKSIAKLDDHILRDMGLTRAEVNWAADQPFTVNAVQALEECNANHLRKNNNSAINHSRSVF